MSDIHVNHPDWIDPDPTPPHGIPRLSADVLAIVDATLGDGTHPDHYADAAPAATFDRDDYLARIGRITGGTTS